MGLQGLSGSEDFLQRMGGPLSDMITLQAAAHHFTASSTISCYSACLESDLFHIYFKVLLIVFYLFFFFVFFFRLHRAACGILVPRAGIEPMPPALGAEF